MNQKKEYPTVEELSNGFSEFRLEQTAVFSGRELSLYDENSNRSVYRFADAETLAVSAGGETITVPYTMVSPREGIYLLDYIESHERAVSVTVVLDMNLAIATVLKARLPTREEADISQLVRAERNLPMTSVTAEFVHASIDVPFTANTPKHEFTGELIGKRVRFRYSANDEYEHIYLNERYYTWHCVRGIEKGLCDTDRCYYLKLADNLYWFTWLEKVVPTIGTVVEDLSPGVMRSFGKIAGYESYAQGSITNFPVGSYAAEV